MGMELAKKIFVCTKSFPKEELYGMTSQMRRCAVSIPSNIAEGSQRSSDKDFANFILIARGSLAELETQSLLALEWKYMNEKDSKEILKICDELSRMLHTFHSKLKAHNS